MELHPPISTINTTLTPTNFQGVGILGPGIPAQSPAKMPRLQWRFLPSFLFLGFMCKNEYQANSRMPSRARDLKIDFEGLQFRPPDSLTPWNLTQSFIWMVPRPLSKAKTFEQLRPLFLKHRPPRTLITPLLPLIPPTIFSSFTIF